MKNKLEILAPAGDMASLRVAIESGADAIYLGIEEFNMRQAASRNFTRESLIEASSLCRENAVKLYLTLNTIVFEVERKAVADMLVYVKPYVDAVIVSDWAVIELCKKLEVPFHISTQMSCSNVATARFLKSQGAERVVLARECTIEEVKQIAAESGIEIETFVHGAICVAVSGRCLLSHDAYGKSGSCGECQQPCRRRFYVKEMREGENADAEFEVTPHTVFSARDLCSITFMDKLVDAGIVSFKIEGRARNPEYVKTVVTAYRKALDAVLSGEFTEELGKELKAECAKIYHREFAKGLYHGRPGKEQLTDKVLNQATTKKLHVGVVKKYYKKAMVIEIHVQNNPVKIGDSISIHGSTSGIVDMKLDEMRQEQTKIEHAEKGGWFTTVCEKKVRENDKVYKIIDVDPAKLEQQKLYPPPLPLGK
ncbi:MAG: U32 family peptidase [Kiritimatiellae bacterium]|jgi:putative protease|nr:U32 family peptidase [Kiritimatiellia bacterium]